MTDIVERLDAVQVKFGANTMRDCESIEDAKTEIETLRVENERLNHLVDKATELLT